MNLLVFIALFFPVVLSGLSLFVFNTKERTLKLIIAFGGAFLLSLSFIELMPEIYKSSLSSSIGLFILLGFFIQLLLDFLTKGVEHGHHQHEHAHVHDYSVNPITILIGICIHSFLEGMPLSANNANLELKNTLLTGIVIHNIPISMVLMGLFVRSGIKKPTAVILLIVFALAAPFGTITSYFIGTEFIKNLTDYSDIILAVVVGIFLHISTTILFETDEHHHFNLYKFIAIILGASVAVLSLF
jgi:zinc and cadmium transporter